MLQVKKELCLGCGICASNCPQQAIFMHSGWAEIDKSRCRECYACVKACPQGAITERTLISHKEIQTTIASLKEKAEDLIKRIEIIRQSRHDLNDITSK